MTEWAVRVAEWDAQWAALSPPATMDDLLDMARTGRWATPAHRAAYDEWVPHVGARIVDVVLADTGHNLLEDR